MISEQSNIGMWRRSRVILQTACIGVAMIAPPAVAQWSGEQVEGALVIRDGKDARMMWRVAPLDPDVGGVAFRPSAFLHPMRTPAGFEWTAALPADHIHHLGLWWPWKHVEVDGTTYNCWELQEGQGAHVAIDAQAVENGPDAARWTFKNEIRVRKAEDGAGPPALDGRAVIDETVSFRAARHGDDANVIDIAIHQRARDTPVRILQYRYSGFSWRGPESWNATNSEMTTSEGLGRDQANGTPGRWVLVTGPTPGDGAASVLMMSAASGIAGEAERLRVWDGRAHGGTPFVNFNPVQRADLPLDDAHPAVSRRHYRVIAADRKLDAAEAEAEWTAWRASAEPPTP